MHITNQKIDMEIRMFLAKRAETNTKSINNAMVEYGSTIISILVFLWTNNERAVNIPN